VVPLFCAQAARVRKAVNRIENLTNGKAIDALLNHEAITIFNNKATELTQYDQHLKAYHIANIDNEAVSCNLNAGQAVILAVGLTAVLTMVAIQGGFSASTAGDLVMANGLILQLWAPLQFLGWLYRELRQSLVDMENFFAILNTKSRIPDGHLVLGVSGRETGGSVESSAFGLAVDMKDVEFEYTSGRPILRGASLSIKPGQNVAVVGGSGSGKSTLLRLLLRLYDTKKITPSIDEESDDSDPEQVSKASSKGSGEIFVDGTPIGELTLDTLRGSMAVVPQDTVLFNDSIYNNILFGDPTKTREDVLAAAKAAKLHETILTFSLGYETVVGERGLKLSGGEKQRVAIARAFLRHPRLLICDEATSALDSETESSIMNSLRELSYGRSAIFVTHRLTTTRHCDIIYVMRAGKVVESGTHDELIAKDGHYSLLWRTQQQEDLVNDLHAVTDEAVEMSPTMT